ncbi:unnamed protein product (macronuclear) [Paramecium tetraurelia]|uniref:Uncharacterized protein n=1 Tax=Paramecium tetraurelia TaxID=5888 RepID=A0DPP5_PARTE|nr:uncharacterized protein GSPATT00019194001 [Paramecium tetraurelia]CAK85012.1 unnamed protein product [Paramecium tetraurelia]|eukprot:XP_001452409.1 hypothetical protein (macronuclear) [Paramecium tetraurelia strain d4-2]
MQLFSQSIEVFGHAILTLLTNVIPTTFQKIIWTICTSHLCSCQIPPRIVGSTIYKVPFIPIKGALQTLNILETKWALIIGTINQSRLIKGAIIKMPLCSSELYLEENQHINYLLCMEKKMTIGNKTIKFNYL